MVAAVGGLALLAGCGQMPPGYTDLFSHVAQGFPAQATMEQARATTPSSDAYHNALYGRLMEHAEYEYVKMMDYRSSDWHANNAMTAARGGDVQPANPGEWRIPSDQVDEVNSARSRLVAALAAGAPEDHPVEAAQAVADYNCWVEQLDENFQPRDIAACRDSFYAALDQIEVREAAVPEVMSLEADVFFDFDRSDIKPAFFPLLDEIAGMLVENTNVRVLVWGHTDRAGTEEYNQGLSERRANAVADYLERKGVSRDRMQVEGFGETKPLVPTADGVREPQNRRVEIRQR